MSGFVEPLDSQNYDRVLHAELPWRMGLKCGLGRVRLEGALLDEEG